MTTLAPRPVRVTLRPCDHCGRKFWPLSDSHRICDARHCPGPDAPKAGPVRPVIPAGAPDCWVKEWDAWVTTAKTLGVDPYAPTKAPHRATVFGAGAAAFFYSIGGKGWLTVARRIKRAAT